jgi:hypothetical protein
MSAANFDSLRVLRHTVWTSEGVQLAAVDVT